MNRCVIMRSLDPAITVASSLHKYHSSRPAVSSPYNPSGMCVHVLYLQYVTCSSLRRRHLLFLLSQESARCNRELTNPCSQQQQRPKGTDQISTGVLQIQQANCCSKNVDLGDTLEADQTHGWGNSWFHGYASVSVLTHIVVSESK